MGDGTAEMGRRSFLRATGATGAAAALGGVAGADTPDEEGTHEFLAGVSPAAEFEAVADRFPEGATVAGRNETLGFVRVEVTASGAYDRLAVESGVADVPGIRYTEPNATLEPLEISGDGGSSPDDPKFDEQYAPQQVNAPGAWETTRGSDEVTVGVVDQGVDYDHVDLRDRFGEDPGYDVRDDDTDPEPGSSFENHGTHVAGIAAATTGNGTGVAGISDCRLRAYRALDSVGGSLADIAEAVEMAADDGCDLVTLSLGGGEYTETLKSAVDHAVANGCLPVAAAGNGGEADNVGYPAAYEEVVAVSAVDRDDAFAAFSDHGPEVDVAAPGVDVLAPIRGDIYDRKSGTSMACPVAAGVAALGKSVDPGLSARELRQLLVDSAADLGLPAEKQGGGRVEAAAMVEAARGDGDGGEDGPEAAFEVTGGPAESELAVAVDGSDSEAGGEFDTVFSYEWAFDDGMVGYGETTTHAYAREGEYAVELTVEDSAGRTDTARRTVSVPVTGGGDGDCGSVTTTTYSEDLDGSVDDAEFQYDARTSDPCGATLSLDGEGPGLDADLYVTLDGRTPTRHDWDLRAWEFGADQELEVEGRDLDDSTTLGILVDCYSGSGSFELTVEEAGDAGGDGGDGGNGDGGDGGDGGGDDGRDGGGDGDRGDGGDGCGHASESTTLEDAIESEWDQATYEYAAETGDPCRVAFELDGPADADFDLYVTEDGRVPTTYDHDRRSATTGAEQTIAVADVSSGQAFGVLVDAWAGTGEFVLTVEELGR